MLKMLNNPAMQPPMGYSHAVEATGTQKMLFVSGQVGVRADELAPGEVAEAQLALGDQADLPVGLGVAPHGLAVERYVTGGRGEEARHHRH